ncbi:uncharacterized protein A4U43_C07F39760 [Asparagus officinalis]|uniref:Uncharacterized protein n=1 Tax=Asparagus officinalis TaxID=4686 RepID=A0A5P1EII3_ASPOF|nr:uncharacterized protein A4U43_C07F39760 [Asparagus officinalis]
MCLSLSETELRDETGLEVEGRSGSVEETGWSQSSGEAELASGILRWAGGSKDGRAGRLGRDWAAVVELASRRSSSLLEGEQR